MTKDEYPTHDIARKNHPRVENDNPVSTAATREPSDRTHTRGHSSGRVEAEPFAVRRAESPFDELPVNSLEIERDFPIGEDIRAATLEILYMVPPHHLHEMYTRLTIYQNTLLSLRAIRGKT